MKLPNFLVVGAAKAGTTSIYNYLKSHPQIYLSDRKEGVFFSDMEYFKGPFSEDYNQNIIRSFGEYTALFDHVRDEKCIGDISPDYLYFYEKSIANIKKYLPTEPKIIIVLRNPIDRAYSNYTFYVKKLMEKHSFEEALSLEEQRNVDGYRFGYRYKDIGMYYNQVKAYCDNFQNVLILDFDQLKTDTLPTVQKILDFLEVSSDIHLNTKAVHNESGLPKNQLIHSFLRDNSFLKRMIRPIYSKFFTPQKREKIRASIIRNNLEKKQMNTQVREELKAFYSDDIQKLQQLVNFDVLKWLDQ